MDRLTEIAFCLPDTARSERFLRELQALFAEVSYAASPSAASVTLTPPEPVGACPVTTFRLAGTPAPQIVLDTGPTIGVSGRNTAADSGVVDLADLTMRLAGSTLRVDHTGVNLPACAVSEEQGESLVQAVAAAGALYRYPTGEPWQFLLPSTAEELLTDIREFVAGREPRFELVLDHGSPHTTWQLALRTSLTSAEVERLFPAPYGVTIPGLEEFFRTVHVRSPWPDLAIRCDLYYRTDNGPTDWETGEWLVTEGGRIR